MADNIEEESKINGGENHPIFENFVMKGEVAVCKICSRSLPRQNSSVSHLILHMARAHQTGFMKYAKNAGMAVVTNDLPPLPQPPLPMQVKTELPDITEPMVELTVPQEELFLPPDTVVPTSITISRVKDQRTGKRDSFFQMPGSVPPFPMPPAANFFPPHNYMPRQRAPIADNRPPHDFSNPIWEYFSLDEDKATCKVCGKRITYRNNAYVTNLVTHLRTRGIGHDTCYNFYMMKKSETSSKVRDEMALNYLLTNMASTVFGQGGTMPTEHMFGPPQPQHSERSE